MLETWRWMEKWQVCFWIDNCYIKQYGTHRTIQDQSQNCTELCVVGITCRLPHFRGHTTIDVLFGSIGNVAAALVRMKQSFRGIVTDLGLLADRPAPIPTISAPLNSVRDPVPNPGWKPLLVTMHDLSSYNGLVEVLDYIASMSNHTPPIVSILVDENIQKGCLKVSYCDRMQHWNWHEKLKRTPILYGCWHPYKYLVTNLSRRFDFLLVYFCFGRSGVRKTVGSYPKRRVIDRIIAGIPECVPICVGQLQWKSNRLQAVAGHGGTLIERLKSVVRKATVKLLPKWCPRVLYFGFLLRHCNWSGRHPGSTIDNHHVLRLLFMLSTEICRAAADPLVYVRTIGVALKHLQVFNSALPKLCYGEKFGGVMFSRLGSLKERLHSSVTDNGFRIRYCPTPSGSSTMERHWVADLKFPSEPYSEPDMDTDRTLLTDFLRTF